MLRAIGYLKVMNEEYLVPYFKTTIYESVQMTKGTREKSLLR